MKKALITGINGFVGPYLQKELSAHGYEVWGCGVEKNEAERYSQVDVTQPGAVADMMKVVEPTHIFHLAGISWPPVAEKNPELAYSVNVQGTKNLLEATLALSKKTRVLIVSSSHVYGRPEYLPVDEHHPLNGTGVYAESRKEQEALALQYVERLSVIVIRSFNHTGPGQSDTLIVPKIIKGVWDAFSGKATVLKLGNVDVKRDISDVRDVVKAYRLLMEQNEFGQVVNVCRGQSVSLKKIIEYASILAEISQVSVEFDPQFVRVDEAQDVYGSVEKLHRLIDWKPSYSYEEMVRDIFNYYKGI